MKILIIDLELAPNLATVWNIWNQNIGVNQLLQTSEILCFSAKWLGENEIIFSSKWTDGKKKMLKKAHALLEEADAIVGYNQSRFDIPILNMEFLKIGLNPPSPNKQIDLLRAVKKNFRFVSNKLDFVCKQLGLGSKTATGGHELWLKVMDGDKDAQHLMEGYNIQDIVLTEKLYYKILPWIHNHPNRSVYEDSGIACPNCGGVHLQKRGIATTRNLRYQRYQCKDCGTWSRSNKSVSKSEERAISA